MQETCAMRLKGLVLAVAICVCGTSCFAQYRVLSGKADPDGCNPTTPARICLGETGEAHCYSPPNDKFGPSDKQEYIFGMEPKVKAVGEFNGQKLTSFTAMFSGCGSGTLTSLSLLTVRDGEFVNLLPKVELTDQSEYRLWNLPQFSRLPVLVTADFIWNFDAMKKSNYNEETHFAAHRYHIEAFVFETHRGRYLRKVSYNTSKRYPGLDEVDEIKVLEVEEPTILTRLK